MCMDVSQVSACICMCLLVSRDEQISAFVGPYPGMSVYWLSLACIERARRELISHLHVVTSAKG
jgi:hypothetical protein